MVGSVTVMTAAPGEAPQLCDGTARMVSGKQHVLYKESTGEGDGERVLTHLLIGEDYFIVRKKGQIDARMLFSEGVEENVLYGTPYGVIPMRLSTEKLEIVSGERELVIDIVYALGQFGGEEINRTLRVVISKK